MNSALIIAEVGVNHNGDLDKAFKLIEIAAKVGADIVKFQTFKSELLATVNAHKAEYQKKFAGEDESQLEMLRKFQLSPSDHANLYDCCKDHNIEFLSTAFDLPSVRLLSRLGLKRWKIPSGEITNLPYLRAIGSMPQPIILSTGMANIGEIEMAINVLEDSGMSRESLTVLHCTTDYPAPPTSLNLRAMQSIAQTFGANVGYSDHSQGTAISIAAVALGASIIEKHITLDSSMSGPDHHASLEPDEFKLMVEGIRTVEKALGDGIKRPSQNELINIPSARKSIVAACFINEGESFNNTNITTKRPGNGLSPMKWDDVIGKTASRQFKIDELIEI